MGKVGSKEPEERSVLSTIANAPKWPVAAGLLLILSGLLTLFIDGDNLGLARKIVGAFLSELGFALIIAFVLHALIEFHAKMEHDKAISRGILSYIYGVDLDDRMFEATEEHIFKKAFYRTEMTVEYDFIKANENNVLIRYTAAYFVHNISKKSGSYTAHSFVEKSPDACGPTFSHAEKLGLQRISIDGVPLTDDELQAARDGIPDSREFFQSSYEIMLDPGEKRHVQVVHLVEKCRQDAELWRSMWPCAGVTLTIRWRTEFALAFHAQPVHPSDRFDMLTEDPGAITARILQPLFPHHGVHFWWNAAPMRQPALTAAKPDVSSTANCDGKINVA